MKKTRLFSIVSLLLLVAMLFTACQPASEPQKPEPPTPQEYENQTVTNNYSANLAAWLKYMSYVAPEKAPVYGKADENPFLEKEGYQASAYNGKVMVSTTVKDVTAVVEEDTTTVEKVIGTESTQTWYDMNTGEVIRTFVSYTPVVEAGEADAAFDLTKWVEYSFDTFADKMFKVTVKTPVLKVAAEDEDPFDPAKYSSYELKTTYNYYYSDGSVFLEGLKEAAATRDVDNYSAYADGRILVDAADKTYLMSSDREIIKEFPLGCEYDVPVYSEEAGTPTIGSLNYTYAEIGDYKYLVTEAIPEKQTIGDLSFDVMPDIQLTVFDKDFNVVLTYDANCYNVAGYTVLANGNVYVCEQYLLPGDATEYDVKASEDIKMSATHKLFNVTDGSVTELDLDFFTYSLFNDNTKEFTSYMNSASIGGGGTPIGEVDVKDGYTVARIKKYKDGNLNQNVTYAVLDKDMKIVEELPLVLPNQQFFPAFVDADTVMIYTLAPGNEVILYSMDVKTGEVNLFNYKYKYDNYEQIDGGYLKDGVIYDYQWRVIVDIKELKHIADIDLHGFGFQVFNGKVWFKTYVEPDPDDEDGKTVYYYRYVSVGKDYSSGYSVSTPYSCSNYDISYIEDGYILYYYRDSEGDIYGISVLNTEFDHIYSNVTNSEVRLTGENEEGETSTFLYKVTEGILTTSGGDVDGIRVTEDGLLITVKVTKTLKYEDDADDVDEYGLKAEYVSYKYYIVK